VTNDDPIQPPASTKTQPVEEPTPRFFAPKSRFAKAVRGALRKLPVLRDPDVQRAAAIAGVVSPTCGR